MKQNFLFVWDILHTYITRVLCIFLSFIIFWRKINSVLSKLEIIPQLYIFVILYILNDIISLHHCWRHNLVSIQVIARKKHLIMKPGNINIITPDSQTWWILQWVADVVLNYGLDTHVPNGIRSGSLLKNTRYCIVIVYITVTTTQDSSFKG